MIRGGTSAAGKTGAMKTGYTQLYLPCNFMALSKTVLAELQRARKTPRYNALVKIEKPGGGEQILTSCSFFQVQKYLSSGIDNGFLTIQKPEVWSFWGSTWKNLLKPSKRSVTILAGIPGAEIEIFKARITGCVETIGGEGGAINLYLNDHRITLQRSTPTALERPRTRYCECHRHASPELEAAGLVFTMTDADVVGEFAPVSNNLSAVAQALSAQPFWNSGSVMTVGTDSELQMIGNDLLSLNDDVITYAVRDFYDASAFNAVNIQGLVGATLTTDTVRDTADIADRGEIFYPSIIGTEFDDLEAIRARAARMIARALAGRLSATVVYVPYLIPGMVLNMQSNRFNIAATTARLQMVRHTYAHGNAASALDGIEVAV